ncbi:MAG: hypothetical protein GWM87_08215 [Xanthomonadales bacterium]|nr:hypothetical protein [Xanthomonadales bacterium]NIX12917.1 hypothetical protein [Xanthomonadales bacterium]
MNKTLPILILALAFSGPLVAGESSENEQPAPATDCEEAVTVFQDVSGTGRKDRAAANMTKRHASMAEDGWRFDDMEIYTENGDLEGFFLTYVRAVACPEASADE